MSKCESNVDELIVPGLVGIPGTVSSRLAEYRDWRGDVQADVSDLETSASNLEIQGLAITAIDFVNPCARYSEVSFELGDDAKLKEELGDVLFAAVKVGRFCGVDPEAAQHAKARAQTLHLEVAIERLLAGTEPRIGRRG